VDVSLRGDEVTVGGGTPFTATGVLDGDDLLLTTGGRTTRWATVLDGPHTWIGRAGESWVLHEEVVALRADAGAAGGAVTSPMPGSVIAVLVVAGETVSKGQPLAVVEAMKMEHTLTAPMDGTVSDVLVRVGQQVKVDELLVTVTA
jgi:acetyl-CoA/propionyl-CoA carboxylase biotin carboxyl carrier protein